MRAPVLAFSRPIPNTRILERAIDALRTLERLAGPDFVERHYLAADANLQRDIACFRRHPAQRWDLDAHCWRPKRARGRRRA